MEELSNQLHFTKYWNSTLSSKNVARFPRFTNSAIVIPAILALSFFNAAVGRFFIINFKNNSQRTLKKSNIKWNDACIIPHETPESVLQNWVLMTINCWEQPIMWKVMEHVQKLQICKAFYGVCIYFNFIEILFNKTLEVNVVWKRTAWASIIFSKLCSSDWLKMCKKIYEKI